MTTKGMMSQAKIARRILATISLGILGIAVAIWLAFGAEAAAMVALVGAAFGTVALWYSPTPPDPSAEEQERIAHVSHELRSPLGSIIGILDLVASPHSGLEPEETQELLGMAEGEAHHLMHLVENLHTASRLAHNTLEPTRQVVDLLEIAERVIARFPEAARRTYLPKGRVVAAWADPQLTMQIITNLVQNAQRYAPDGELEFTMERQGGTVALSISDDGPGIADAADIGLFTPHTPSGKGLGIGLSLSRELARRMGGDLTLSKSIRKGATFTLRLPHAAEPPERLPAIDPGIGAGTVALSPRSRLLVDMAAALSEQSLDRTVAGLRKLYVSLLDAVDGVLFLPAGQDIFQSAGSFARSGGTTVTFSDSTIAQVMRTSEPVAIDRIADLENQWRLRIDGTAALFLPVLDLGKTVGVLVISWASAEGLPSSQRSDVARALAQIAAFAIHRSNLVVDIAYERGLRASVMESLPIAISVFAGDPPRVVDWNKRERVLLGIAEDVERPSDLDESQRKFEVRFADGTPLTVENAPVAAAIRSGESKGPFLLVVRRADGTDIMTRTYCAPFFDESGHVAGAVVTSEELDIAVQTGRSVQPESATDDENTATAVVELIGPEDLAETSETAPLER